MSQKKTSKKFKTRGEKAAAIAQDVIKHLNSIKVQTGIYVDGDDEVTQDVPTQGCAQQHIDTLAKKCEVCALGACFLSHIRLFNQVKLEDVVSVRKDYKYGPEGARYEDVKEFEAEYETLLPHLKKAFDAKTLILIESAFECQDMNHNSDGVGYGEPIVSAVRTVDAVAFGLRFKNPKNRLKAIMENVVANKGKFVPPKVKGSYKIAQDAQLACGFDGDKGLRLKAAQLV